MELKYREAFAPQELEFPGLRSISLALAEGFLRAKAFVHKLTCPGSQNFLLSFQKLRNCLQNSHLQRRGQWGCNLGRRGPSEGQQVLSSLTGRAGDGQGLLIPVSLQHYPGRWPRVAGRGGHLQVDKLLKHFVLIGTSCCTCLFKQSILITVSTKAC